MGCFLGNIIQIIQIEIGVSCKVLLEGANIKAVCGAVNGVCALEVASARVLCGLRSWAAGSLAGFRCKGLSAS